MSETEFTSRIETLAFKIKLHIPLKHSLPLPWDEFNRRARQYVKEKHGRRKRTSWTFSKGASGHEQMHNHFDH